MRAMARAGATRSLAVAAIVVLTAPAACSSPIVGSDAGRDAPAADVRDAPAPVDGCDLTSVDHCGACALACPRPPAHGSPTCTMPTGCGVECDPPFPLLSSGTSVFCGPFGGLWQSAGTPTTLEACLHRNPFTGACSCPTGYAERRIGAARSVAATGVIGLCELDADAVADTTWGGLFVANDSAGNCLVPNRLTGACTCRLGTMPSGELYQSANGSGDALHIAFCRAGAGSTGSAPFAGAFTMCMATCLVGSDGCTCPATTTALAFDTLARGGGVGPCDGQSTVCLLP